MGPSNPPQTQAAGTLYGAHCGRWLLAGVPNAEVAHQAVVILRMANSPSVAPGVSPIVAPPAAQRSAGCARRDCKGVASHLS